MKKSYTHVTFVLDNSGSMLKLKDDTIGGFNEFIRKQKSDPGTMTFSLYQFLHSYIGGVVPPVQPVKQMPIYPPNFGDPRSSVMGSSNAISGLMWNSSWINPESPAFKLPVKVVYEFVDIQAIPELNEKTYTCETDTPLLDTIGHGITKTGEILLAMKEEDRPEKVVFVILTDGKENASLFYKDKNTINAMITEQRSKYNWEFVFLGANQDAIQTGMSYGIAAGASMTYAATGASVGATYNALSETLTRSKTSGVTMDFCEDVREKVFKGEK